MPDPKQQAATQLRNIEASTGKSLAQFIKVIRAAGLEKHGAIVAHLKSEFGLTHGNANLLSHLIREQLAGGPAPATDLLEAQFAGKKAGLRPIYDELAALAESLGPDVEKVIQKTGVSFRRAKQFALIKAPAASRIELGLNLPAGAEVAGDARIEAAKGMCSHRINVTSAEEIDDTVAAALTAAYEAAGPKTK